MADTEARWYCVNAIGQATLCADFEDANTVAAESFVLYPQHSPYRAVQLGEVGEVVAERDRLRAQVEDMRTAVHSCHPGCSNARCVAERLRADVRELVELAAETVNEWDYRIVDGDDYAACRRVIEDTMAPLRALLAKHQPLQALAARSIP